MVNNVRQKIYIFAFIRKNNRKAGYGDLTSASYYISILANEKNRHEDTNISVCHLLIGFLFANHLHSQESPYVFRYIGVTDGLPDNYVKSVFPIPDGRIGIRTTVLLSLYDGSNYSNFPFNLRGEYPISYNHIIPEQYVDADKRLWMKERGALRVFDLTTEQYIYNVDSLLLQFGIKERITDVFIDSEKHYWF